MSKLNPWVFKDAAGAIADGSRDACCFALDTACNTIMEADVYIAMMRKTLGVIDKSGHGFWWSDFDDCNPREARIIALLLCAEMCKA